MSLKENTGAIITLSDAQNYIKAFKLRFPDEITGQFIGALNVKLILDQPGCIGIRIYNGYDEVQGRFNSVLVGVNTNEQDMTDGIIMDRMAFCPPFCSVASELLG